ncbi:hypothetical protein JOD20_003342 [Herpetosiphon giganteus]|nr:hypothetical protein [Herpetosiphon giganteus]
MKDEMLTEYNRNNLWLKSFNAAAQSCEIMKDEG